MTSAGRVQLVIEARDGAARAATATTRAGTFTTPCFMPVATRGGVRALEAADIEKSGYSVMLSNTYHLALRPGAPVVEKLGGIHRFSGFGGTILTDSGGYQIYSLGARYDEDGATFRSVYDGSSHVLTPEGAVEIQGQLGSDIQMVLDVCAPLPSDRSTLVDAMDLTSRWAHRALEHHRALFASAEDAPALFGIVQGGDAVDLRVRSAQAVAAMDFDGYGIGGLSVGEDPHVRQVALEAALSGLPVDRPRYLMGVGDPVGIVDAVACGVDMFDCVLPTRLARHGTLLTDQGRLNLRRAEFAADGGAIEDGCRCPACSRYSRGYLRHLLTVGDPSAMRLASLHNLSWMRRFLDRVRRSIEAGTLGDLRSEIAGAYGTAGSTNVASRRPVGGAVRPTGSRSTSP